MKRLIFLLCASLMMQNTYSNIVEDTYVKIGEFFAQFALGNFTVNTQSATNNAAQIFAKDILDAATQTGKNIAQQVNPSPHELASGIVDRANASFVTFASTLLPLNSNPPTLEITTPETPIANALGELKQAGSHFVGACMNKAGQVATNTKDAAIENTKALVSYTHKNLLKCGNCLYNTAKSGASSAWDGTKYGCGVAYDYTTGKLQSGATIAKDFTLQKAREYPKTTTAIIATPICYVIAKAKLETAEAQLKCKVQNANLTNALAIHDRISCLYIRNLTLRNVQIEGFWQRIYVALYGLPALNLN